MIFPTLSGLHGVLRLLSRAVKSWKLDVKLQMKRTLCDAYVKFLVSFISIKLFY